MMSLKKLINMIRLWCLLWYFTRSDRPTAEPFRDEIKRDDLVFYYLAHQKHFLENWLGTFRRWYYLGLVGNWPLQTTSLGGRLMKKHLKAIEDTIDRALKYDYLLISRTTSLHPTSSETYLTVDWRGRNFLYNPLAFLNAVFAEYGYFTSFIFGSGGTLLIIFFEEIISYFATMGL